MKEPFSPKQKRNKHNGKNQENKSPEKYKKPQNIE